MDSNRIGLVIKTLRIKKGLTQQQLADGLGVTDKAVSKWERGIGTPDISMINRLSIILNIDADNLLAANLAYLEDEWIGELRLDKFQTSISITTEVLGKPTVYLYFCYFALAGISEIYVYCSEKEEESLIQLIGNGECYGLILHYNEDMQIKKKMVIEGPFFLYGPNLTKYFQRAMSHGRVKTSLVLPRGCSNNSLVFLDGKNQVLDASSNLQGYEILPIHFVNDIDRSIEYEPLGKGMIGIELLDIRDVLAVSNLLHIISFYSGEQIYVLEEIVFRRGLIDCEQLQNLANGNAYLLNLARDR